MPAPDGHEGRDTMLAAVLREGARHAPVLALEQVPSQTPAAGQVLVRVAAAGLCHSDLHLIDGDVRPEDLRLPVTLGHEFAGWVESCGPGAIGVEIGEAVVALCVWGCGRCRWCSTGDHELCPDSAIAGATADGGFAERVIVPRGDRLVALGELDPVRSAPLGDAALTPYRALLRVRTALDGDATLVVIGVGGLGEYAIQLAKLLTGAKVVAVEPRASRRARALALGADIAIDPTTEDPEGVIADCAGRRGAGGVIDLVGSDVTLALAASVVGPRGIIAVVGLAGGAIPMSFRTLAAEASWTTVLSGGNRRDLQDVVELARRGLIEADVARYPLDQIDRAIADLRQGTVEGRAVLVPHAGT